jgi:hypothetical protein
MNSLKAMGWSAFELAYDSFGHQRTLCIPHHYGIILLIMREAFDEPSHVESVELAIGFLLLRRASEILSVRIEQAGQTTHECGSDPVCMEGLRAYQRDLSQAPPM